MTDERKKRDIKQADWQKRLEYLRLSNQGWSPRKIAQANGVSTQSVYDLLAKLKNMTVEEAESYIK